MKDDVQELRARLEQLTEELSSAHRHGRVDVFGSGANALVALKVDQGHGTVAVYNEAGFPVATMVERNAGGVLTAHGPNGAGVFVANWEPPTGHGEACVIRRNGKWCVGINLPLGIGAGRGP
jgi:hypothetical protein